MNDDPPPPSGLLEGPDRALLPDGLLEALDDVGRTLPGRGHGHLADAVAALSAVYTRERDRIDTLPGELEALQARLRFFLPRDLPKIGGPLAELARADRLPPGPTWRVLDLGAGMGATSLGAAWFAARHAPGVARIEVTAIERDGRALSAFEQVAARAPALGLPEVRVEGRREDLRRLDRGALGADHDLILLGFVLNELGGEGGDPASQADLLVDLCGHLSEAGALVVLEPALRETSRHLHQVRDRLAARDEGAHVFSPCLHRGPCPMLEGPRDWCHEEMRVALPPPLAEVARAAGLRYETLTYSYLVLRRVPGSLRDALTAAETERLARIVSRPLKTKGKLELFGCGEGGRARMMRLDRDTRDCNEALGRAARGSIVRVRGAREKGDRLRVDAGTDVELL